MIYFIRHYFTEFNLQSKFQTSIDNSIITIDPDHFLKFNSMLNISQVLHIDEAICSPLIRTQETAKALGFNNITIDHRITELDFGILDGVHIDELKKSEDIKLWDRYFPIDGTERKDDFRDRLHEFLEEYKDSEKPIIVFTHGIVMRSIMCDILNIKFNLSKIDEFKFDPISILKINFKNNKFLIEGIYNFTKL